MIKPLFILMDYRVLKKGSSNFFLNFPREWGFLLLIVWSPFFMVEPFDSAVGPWFSLLIF